MSLRLALLTQLGGLTSRGREVRAQEKKQVTEATQPGSAKVTPVMTALAAEPPCLPWLVWTCVVPSFCSGRFAELLRVS